MKDVVALVLAAGKGTRMYSDLAKVLHPICGRPMLSYTLEELGEFNRAVSFYETYLRMLGDRKPTYPHARLSLGRMYRDLFYDLELAERYFREAIEIFEFHHKTEEVAKYRIEIKKIRERRAMKNR